MSRKYTNKLLEMVQDSDKLTGHALSMCLLYMSEADVEDMMRVNELIEDEETP